MHKLFADFSFPPYVWIGLGVFLTLLLTSAKFRSESDALLAHMLGLKPKQERTRQNLRHSKQSGIDTDSDEP